MDGLQPQVAVEPKSGEEIGDLLRLAGSQNWGIVPFGAGTKQGMGNSLRRFDVALSLANFNRVPEYQPEDLVVKVESGCRLVDLQRTLAPDNLFLPIDPPYYNESTLGGIVASNASGPWRFAHGTMRDFLLGISVVQPDGTRTKFGARVVKNVTGYDMCKLYVGSFGTLGILTDFYFKLKPLQPEMYSVLSDAGKDGRSEIHLPFGMPRFVNARTLKAMLGAKPWDRLFRKTGTGWNICPDSLQIDITDSSKVFRLGKIQVLS